MNSGALSGLLVADFSRVLAGPYATMLLGDLGAEVVKVERPGKGDDTRSWGPPFAANGQTTYFQSVNRNKRARAIDLTSESGFAQARELACRADILVENFRPGTLTRLGLGYQALHTENPGLIYCSISGFGSGAGAGLPGYDALVQAVGGLMSVTGESPDHPTKVGVALVDVITGLHAVYGILAALRHRDVTGRGQLVEVNLLSSLLSAMVNQSAAWVNAGIIPASTGNDHPSVAPYGLFRAADEDFVIAVGNDHQFQVLCETLGCPELAADARFGTNPDRVVNRDALRGLLESRLRAQTAATWCADLTDRGIPCGPINDLAAAFGFAQSLGLDPIVEIDEPPASSDGGIGGPVRQVANPVHFSETPASYRLPPPALDTTGD
ncbi:MAG: CoA transferase [Actinomycetes bacterium]